MALLTPSQIARLFVYPENILTCTILGSSRFSCKWSRIGTHLERVPMSGTNMGMAAVSSVGHDARDVPKLGGTTPTPSPLIGGLQTWFGWGSTEVAFTGVVEPGATVHANRIASAYYSQEQMPLLWDRLNGHAVKCRCVAYRHAAGLDTGLLAGPRFYLMNGSKPGAGGWGPPNYVGDYFTNTTGTGYLVNEFSVPDTEDWGPYFGLALSCNVGEVCAPGGQILAVDASVLELQRPGVVWIGEATGGSGVYRYTLDTIYPEAIFRDLWPLKGANRAMFIECNGESFTQEVFAGYVVECVRRFRSGTPDGPVILCTGYGNEFEDTYLNPRATWLSWMPAIAESIGGCLLLDTNTVLGPFAANFAAGRYTSPDLVHFNDKGDSDLFWLIGEMLFDSATGGMVMASHGDPTRGKFAADVLDDIDAGAGAGILRIRESATTIAEITLDDPSATRVGAVLTFDGFPKSAYCVAAGTPNNALVLDSDGNTVLVLTAGVGVGFDVNLPKPTYGLGEPLKAESATYTAPP